MDLNFVFIFSNFMLGIALAMDAFSVSLANGLNEPGMRPCKMVLAAGIFGSFQGLMPFLGWLCICTLVQYFAGLEALIPWVALILLSYIGGKMLFEGIKCRDGACEITKVTFVGLLVQGVATSIDALSAGLEIANQTQILLMALAASGIIALVTFVICLAGLYIGKKAGTKLAGKAGIFGGIILILIGLEIFITSWF